MNSPKFLQSKLWKEIMRPVAVLLVISIAVAAALSGTNALTANKISELSLKEKQKSMMLLFQNAEFEEQSISDSEIGDFTFSKAFLNGELAGYIFTASANGYGGEVEVMTAVNSDGTVRAVSILSVADETPGLGQNAAKPEFYGQLEGLSAQKEVVLNKTSANAKNNEITPVTGATITSSAVKDAVNKALAQYALVTETEEQDEK